MLLSWTTPIKDRFREFLSSHFQISPPELTTDVPPRMDLGDLAFTFPFQLAKTLRKAPGVIAREVVENIGEIQGVDRMEAVPPGFINLYFDRHQYFAKVNRWLEQIPAEPQGNKVIVEHTNINPNKAAHIGHLRNAVLGDTFVRMLRSLGRLVEVQNYIDNTGVQVADVVVGFHFLRGMSVAQVEHVAEPFDYYCWDLYAEVSDWYSGGEERPGFRQQVLAAIEAGESPFFDLSELVANRIVKAHLRTMDRLGVRYDVLPRESEILHLHFWEEAFRLLKEKKAIYFSEEGPTQGCWVMYLPGENGQPDEHKIIVRSNGTVTYVGKDIAYQLWKFGLLGRTFHYKPFFEYPDGHPVWVTSATAETGAEPAFGSGQEVFNVIDVRQSYLQRVVVQGLRGLGYLDEAERSVHFSYEMVALSPRCCRDLGIQLSPEDQERPYVEVSGRKGLGVKADDLIDKLIEKSAAEVLSRQPDLPQEKRAAIAGIIAVGALRYFMLKYTRNSVIAFDFEEALSFEGETGPYLQYSVVRAQNIFRRLSESGSACNWGKNTRDSLTSAAAEELLKDDDTWSLIREIGRSEEIVRQAVESLEVSGIARQTFTIAQQFNSFYHTHHILSEPDRDRQLFYLTVANAAFRALTRQLGLLGIDVPEKM